jgi:outer membrane lipoprotein LolB
MPRTKSMPRLFCLAALCMALSACVTTRPKIPPSAAPWQQRSTALQALAEWKLEGRAAVAVGQQGWQANLDWQQQGAVADVHLAGPLGVGAVALKRTRDGVSLNGAPPSEAVVAQLQDRLGFDLPLDNLRYWLLGVPDPSTPFDLTRDEHDRAQQIVQAGWTVAYDKYLAYQNDWLPARVVLSRDDVRVRIVVDHWSAVK